MTITNSTFYNAYTGDGATTVFPFTWRLTENQMMAVFVGGVLQTLGTNYSFTTNANTTGYGGSVIFVTPPALNAAIVIQRASDLLQNNALINNQSMPPSTVMAMVDKLGILIQQIVNSTFGVPANTPTFSASLPAPVAGAIPAVNAAATGAAWIPPQAAGLALLSNGAGALPSFQPVASIAGGNVVGAASSPQYGIPYFADTTGKVLAAPASAGTAGQAWASNGPNAAPSYQTIAAVIPNTVVQFGGPEIGASLRPLLNVPVGLTVTPTGTTGATTCSYKVVALDATGTDITAASAQVTTATANATLTGANYNALACTAVTGAASYRWYRTAAGGTPATLGLIGTTTLPAFNDTGAVGDASTAPASSTFTGDHWHNGAFTTDAPVTSTRLRLHISGTFTQRSSDTITISTELAGGTGPTTNYSNTGAGRGAGAGQGGIYSSGAANVYGSGSGGGNGGAGGNGGSTPATVTGSFGGAAYGIELQLSGSSGGAGCCLTTAGGKGGDGGGALMIESGNAIVMNGTINGIGGAGGAGTGASDGGGGGGSGATVYLTCVNGLTLAGTAVLNLNGGAGGNGATGGAGGGGGRLFGRAGGALVNSASAVVTGGIVGTTATGATLPTAGSAGVVDVVGTIGYSVRTAA